jgi:hypothetical protein
MIEVEELTFTLFVLFWLSEMWCGGLSLAVVDLSMYSQYVI